MTTRTPSHRHVGPTDPMAMRLRHWTPCTQFTPPSTGSPQMRSTHRFRRRTTIRPLGSSAQRTYPPARPRRSILWVRRTGSWKASQRAERVFTGQPPLRAGASPTSPASPRWARTRSARSWPGASAANAASVCRGQLRRHSVRPPCLSPRRLGRGLTTCRGKLTLLLLGWPGATLGQRLGVLGRGPALPSGPVAASLDRQRNTIRASRRRAALRL